MVDWNNPTTTRNYSTEILQDIKSRDDSCAIMFEGSSDTNIPTNAKRLVAAGDLTYYNGSTWVQAYIKPVIPNATNIIFRNAADSGYIGVLQVDGSNNTLFDTASAHVFAVSSTQKWAIDGAGYFRPITTLGASIGSSSYRVSEIFGKNIKSVETVENNSYGSEIRMKATAVDLILNNVTGGTTFELDTGGDFKFTGATVDGTSRTEDDFMKIIVNGTTYYLQLYV